MASLINPPLESVKLVVNRCERVIVLLSISNCVAMGEWERGHVTGTHG